jgi:ABC-2 type transport system ATP-binding protein
MLAATAAGALALGTLAAVPATPTTAGALTDAATALAEGDEVSNGSIESFDGTAIHYTLFKPAAASASTPVPMVLHSHGWGGSRTRSGFQAWLDAGFGVLSFDQRGFGQSGGEANVQDPEFEAQDVKALIDLVASLDWVAKDVDPDTGLVDPTDPQLAAIGGSYGGGYQLVTALTELRESGETRFDALAPEITWFDLPESLAPQKVVRTTWVSALFAAGATAVPDYIREAFVYGAATGQWPDGSEPTGLVPDLDGEFHEHGPVAFVEDGIQLDIPVLFRPGTSDNLFNLNQAVDNFQRALSDEARERSFLIGYNGGHALPNALPLGYASGSDACSGSEGFAALTREFFRRVFAGEDTSTLLPASYNLTEANGSSCIRTDSIDRNTVVEAGFDVTVTSGALTTTGAGAPQYLQLTDGKAVTVAGVPTMTAQVTSVGVEQRAFFGLAVGTSPATARVVQNNVMPLRKALPVVQEKTTIELPGVAVDVPAGQFLYLVVSPLSDMFPGHGSTRTPGLLGLEDITVHLPVQGG